MEFFFQKRGFETRGNSVLIFVVILASYLSLWNSSIRFSLPFPVTVANSLVRDWKNYVEMMCLYFLALNVIKREGETRTIVIVMTLVILLLSIRSYRNYTAGATFQDPSRVSGPFETVGLGANHFGAFIAEYCAVILGMIFYEQNRSKKVLYIASVLFGLHPLFFCIFKRGVCRGIRCSDSLWFVKEKNSFSSCCNPYIGMASSIAFISS